MYSIALSNSAHIKKELKNSVEKNNSYKKVYLQHSDSLKGEIFSCQEIKREKAKPRNVFLTFFAAS